MLPGLEPRLIELEVRFAQQEKVVSELNDVITAQWKKIDALERQLRRLGEEMESLATAADAPAANVRPPHY